MNKFSFSLLAVLLLTSSAAFANFTGRWQGQGKVTDISGGTLRCDVIQFRVDQTTSALKILQGYIYCKPQELKVADMSLRIYQDGLYLDGDKIGSISDDSIRLSYIRKDGIRVRSLARLKDSKLQYQEEWMDKDNNRVLFFQGLLTRQ